MIVITGASDGLGHRVAKLYKEAGKKVVNISRRNCEYSEINLLYDLRKGTEVKTAVEEVLKIDEPLEAVINCIGVYTNEELGKISDEEVQRALDTNVKAPVLLTSGLMERIKEDGADILNVASTVGLKAYPGEAIYGASKWAVRGFSANLQLELKNAPCRVISFCPGGFKTKLFEKAMGYDNTGEGTWMSAEDVAKVLKYTLDLPKNMEISEIFLNRKQS